MIKPDFIAGKVESVTPNGLKYAGYTGQMHAAIYDVDGTLMPYHTHELSSAVLTYLHEMGEQGVRLFVASNSYGGRADELNELFPAELVERVVTPRDIAGEGDPRKFRKPSPAMLNEIMREAQLTGSETVVVGDQLLKDVVAARRSHGVPLKQYVTCGWIKKGVTMIDPNVFEPTITPETPQSVLVSRLGREDHPVVRLFQRPAEAAIRAVNHLPLLPSNFPDNVEMPSSMSRLEEAVYYQ